MINSFFTSQQKKKLFKKNTDLREFLLGFELKTEI
jgi:hypothetical protein